MADKKYKDLPTNIQTTTVKNFFESTVEQLFSKANVENLSAYIGRKEFDDYNPDTDVYVPQSTPNREKYSLEPVVNSVDQLTGLSTNLMFYDDFLNVLKSYGVDTQNQNNLFSSNFYSLLPPIDEDKFVNFQEYFWSPEGPQAIVVSGTASQPINILKDIIGKKTFTDPSGYTFKNGAVVEFAGDYVIPQTYKDSRYIIEGVGNSIILHNKEQNFSASFSTPSFAPWDQEIITGESNLILTDIPQGAVSESIIATHGYLDTSTGLYYYFDAEGEQSTVPVNSLQDIDLNGNPFWEGYVSEADGFLVYINDGIYGFDNEPWDGGNTQETPDYILMQRGAQDKNIWSRINFWHHKNNFIDSGSELPGKEFRAKRPILEFDRDIEVYNFGTLGLDFNADLSAAGYTKAEIEGRPISAPIDSQGIKEENIVLIPDDTEDNAKYVYIVKASTTKTVVGSVSNSSTFIVDDISDVYLYSTITGNGISTTVQVEDIDTSSKMITTSANVTLTDQQSITFGDRVILKRKPADNNPVGAVDGDSNFIPFVPEVGNSISILFGSQNQGTEYFWDGKKWILGQKKTRVNSPILFKAYDGNRNIVDDDLVYPESSFKGTKLFSYKDATSNTQNDSVLGFPLQYKNFNNFSEIVFNNNLSSDVISYVPFGGTTNSYINGYLYYKQRLSNGNIEYRTMWRGQNTPFEQVIEDRYQISQDLVDAKTVIYNISATPTDSNDIRVYINGKRTKAFTYNSVLTAIQFASFGLKLNDIIDIKTKTSTGHILGENRTGRYEIPLSWDSNTDKVDIFEISEPQYLEHFKNLINNQEHIDGEPLGSNNFSNLTKEIKYADKIVQTDDDLQTAAFLVSNDNFNIIDAIRYNAEEYIKYKNRLRKEIKRYIDGNDIIGLTNSNILELAIQNVIAYNPGKLVFDYSYMLAIGDRYDEETIVINNVNQKEYVLSRYSDLTKVENVVYVYETDSEGKDQMLLIDTDYSINSDNSIVTLTFTDNYTLSLGSTIKARFFNTNRESAQCPPTPSAMGLYPVTKPEIFKDTTFNEPINVVLGHDGSKHVAVNDKEDEILLEFERRVYNTILQVYRDKESHPDLNVFDIRPGRFRTTGFSRNDFYNILRESFNKFVTRNEVDFVTNEYYKEDDFWTWNYNSNTVKPAYWRGIFESCYDTEKPHTHPWEMLGFTKKPTWWEEQYGTDYGSTNTDLWKDLEEGIIRQGTRANIENDRYKTRKNPFRRIGLKYEIPVDAQGNLIPPANIISTTSTTKSISWTQSVTGTPSANANTFIATDGLSISEYHNSGNTFINVTTNNIPGHDTGTFPSTNNTNEIVDSEFNYSFQFATGIATGNLAYYNDYANATSTSNTAIGIAVNGAMITNSNTGIIFEDSSNWHYNAMFRNDVDRDTAGGSPDSNNIYGYVQPSPQTVGLTSWATDSHSPIVGWAFDGLPIYGPYGYTDGANASSAIKRIESSYELRSDVRSDIASGATGLPTGEFIEDYAYNPGSGDLDQFNGRFGVTPEYPAGTYYYVATIDANSEPAYPYTVGGKFIDTPDLSNNLIGTQTLNTNGTLSYSLDNSESTVYSANSTLASSNWKFSDGAPVENAWKISEYYPFAIIESLFLTKPGKFASVFAEPEKLIRVSANTNQLVDKNTNKRYKVKNAIVHGDIKADGKTLCTNTGYTQFIDSYLRFQGLNNTSIFAKPFRSVNGKLGHKFAGFIDKDTMTVFSDTYSTTGNSSSLILPQEDLQIDIHEGPVSTTNNYTGVLIEKVSNNGYKVSGYSSLKRYFDIIPSDKQGRKTEVSVGGEPANFSNYDTTKQFNEGNIVKSGYNYYRAVAFASAGTAVTDTTVWQRMSALPNVGGAEATFYLDGTGTVERVEYGTVYYNVNDLFDFLTSLGRYQKSIGFDFGEFSTEINDINDWLYSGKQFLFWSIGKWSTGNTLNLSPMANKVSFATTTGRINRIQESYKGQFSILDQEGKMVSPRDCEIVRESNSITIATIDREVQIYGITLHTNELEHSMLVNNKSQFGDTIYDPVFNQRQKRLKIKGKRTANWNGTLSSEGFIITDNGLKPNFDTLASDIGRYNEIGYMPVEKQVYDASRRQYGYQERKYLREFELVDDNQFDFYQGMIRNKGTKDSLEILLNSDKVFIPGNVSIFDQWALKIGNFGDTDNRQRLDVKIDEDEIKSEKTLVQIVYPENIVSIVDDVEVLSRNTKFYTKPILEIEPPPAEIPGSFTYGGGTTAEATVNLSTDGTISNVTVTEKGYGYTINPSVTVVAAQLLTANLTTYFSKPYAISSDYVSGSGTFANALTGIHITDHFAPSGNANTFIDLSGVTTLTGVANAINSTANTNANIVARAVEIATSTSTNYLLEIQGNDFQLSGQGNSAIVDDITNKFLLEERRYQPRQRYSFETANSTAQSDIIATVDGNITSAGNDWVFDEGSRTTIRPTSRITGGNVSFNFVPTSVSDGVSNTNLIDIDNRTVINGIYPHLDVFIDGQKLDDSLETSSVAGYIVSESGSNNIITFYDVSKLPGGELNENSVIEVVEYGTLDFEDTYQGDLPGSVLNIKVTANDALAAKLKQIRTFEITPDVKTDSTILIDVDDGTRMIHRPTDMATNDLWPTTSSVSHLGIVDSKYTPLPNAGYISKYNVNYQAMDLQNFEQLFDRATRKASKIPQANDLIHFAIDEHSDFNAYQLVDTNCNVAYVEGDLNSQSISLFTNKSLMQFTDGNRENTANNINKYYDNVVAFKRDKNIYNAYYDKMSYADGEKIFDDTIMDLTTPVGLFLNEEQVVKNSFDVTDITYTRPMVLGIEKIEPNVSGNVLNIQPHALFNEGIVANANIVGNNIVEISIVTTQETVDGTVSFSNQFSGLTNGSYVNFVDTSGGNLNGNNYEISNLNVTAFTTNGTQSSTANTSVPVISEVSGTVTNSKTVTLLEANTDIRNGMSVLGTGVENNTKVNQISGTTITLSQNANISSGANITFVSQSVIYTTTESSTTTFTIEDATVSSNVSTANLTIGKTDGLIVTTDFDTTTLTRGDDVKIQNAGLFEGVHRIKDITVNGVANTISIPGDYVAPLSITSTFTGVDTANIQLATANSSITDGMLVTGGNVAANCKVLYIDAGGNIILSSNADSSANSSITFTEDRFGNATLVDNYVTVTFTEDHDLTIDSAGQDTILEHVVNIGYAEPGYYNWAWRAKGVPTANTLLVQGYGYDHPVPVTYTTTFTGTGNSIVIASENDFVQKFVSVSGGDVASGTKVVSVDGTTVILDGNADSSANNSITFSANAVSEKQYLEYGNSAQLTVGNPEGNAYLSSTHKGKIFINGMPVATAFPMYSSQQYVDDINYQLQIKQGAVAFCGSIQISIPFITPALKAAARAAAMNAAGTGLQNFAGLGQVPAGTINSKLQGKQHTLRNSYNHAGLAQRVLNGGQHSFIDVNPGNSGNVTTSGPSAPVPAYTPPTTTQPAAQSTQIPIATPIGPKLSVAAGTLDQSQESRYNNASDPTSSNMAYIDYTNSPDPKRRAMGGVWMGTSRITYGWHPKTGVRGLWEWIGGMGFHNSWKDPNRLPPPPGSPTFGPVKPTEDNTVTNTATNTVTNTVTNTLTTVVNTIQAPGSSGNYASAGTNGTSFADFSPIIDITQNDTPCPPPPPVPPTPPVPPVKMVTQFITNTKGRGVTETTRFKFATDDNNGAGWPIKILFDMFSAKDKMTVYQGTTAGSTGRTLAGTGVAGTLSQLTATDKTEYNRIRTGSNNTQFSGGIQNYTAHGNGFVKENGKLSFTYYPANGQYITVKLEKDGSTSTAYNFAIEYPSDDGQPLQGSVASVGNPSNNANPGVIANGAGPWGNGFIPPGGLQIGGGYGSGFSGANTTFNFSGINVGIGSGGGTISYNPVYQAGLTNGYPSYNANTAGWSPTLGWVDINGNAWSGTLISGPQAQLTNTNPGNQGQGNTNHIGLTGHTPTGGTTNTSQIPVCTPKPRIKVCGQTKSVGQGDTFYINGTSVTLSGATSIDAIANEIRSQVTSVTVHVTPDGLGDKCLTIRNKTADPMVVRNGCAGGVYKEVLDYTLQKDQQMCFNKEVVQGPTTLTNTASGSGNATIVGTSVASFTTDTITPEERLANNDKQSICLTKGSGYAVGDVLRVMGGTPVVGLPSSELQSITVNNGGFGYVKDSIRVVIGQTGEPGTGALVDYSGIEVDGSGAITKIPLASGGDGYSMDNPPTITIIGTGRNASVSARTKVEHPAVEKPARFVVNGVGPDGEITDIQIITRGIYKIFPSDLDSGVPLEYDIKRPQSGTPDSEILGSSGHIDNAYGDAANKGAGFGARIFLTAREIPSCSEKGNALTDLGLPNGVIYATTPEQQLADDISLFSELDENGNPLFSADVIYRDADGNIIPSDANLGDDGLGNSGLGRGGVPNGAMIGELVLSSPTLMGIEIDDNLNPGLLDTLGVLPGTYYCGPGIEVTNNDGSGVNPAISVQQMADGFPFNGAAGRGVRNKPWQNGWNFNMNLGNITQSQDMFKYDITTITGDAIQFTRDDVDRQYVKPLVLESMRHDTESGLDLANISNAWIDSYGTTGGWAYLESNTVIRQQEKLADIKFVKDVFTYDEDTAQKEFELNLYDPFKGIIPGFIDKEIIFKSENDPVVYNPAYTKFGKEQVGATWWNTSKVKYEWYEQGAGTYDIYGYNNEERIRNWGSMFPNSKIEIVEWIESLLTPEEFNLQNISNGVEALTPSDGSAPNFILETRANDKGKLTDYYYFWVEGKTTVDAKAFEHYGRERSTVELVNLLSNPEGQRLPYFAMISPEAMGINMLGDLIKTENSILSLNYTRRPEKHSQQHTSWQLASEGDKNSSIPSELSVKLIDSLAGINGLGEDVPAKGLSEAERYGSSYRPRQTMFKYIKEARKQMFNSLNSIFKELKMDSTFDDWRNSLPTTLNYLDTVNWFEELRTNKVTNSKIYYNSDYKPLRKVATTKQLELLKNVLDRSVIQVQSNSNSKYSLYEYSKSTDTFKLIAIEDETVEWNEKVYKEQQSNPIAEEIRNVLLALYNNVFVGSSRVYWNRFFFDMVKYAYSEQTELNWAFKTTYLNIVKEETDLVPLKGFKVDNFDKAIDYFNEVKPYSSKIQNYSDIKKPATEIVSGTSTDFDRPPYFDSETIDVRVLDDSVSADANILATDSTYAGFISSNAPIRSVDTKIVFDRVKADLFENSSGMQTQTFVASADIETLALNFVPSEADRIVVKRNDEVVPATSTNLNTGNSAVTNYTFDSANNVIILSKTGNAEFQTVSAGDVIEVSVIDGFDPTKETINVSIAKNIVSIMQNSNANISNTQLSWTASDRLFKFDPEIISQFTHDMESTFGEGVLTNATVMTNVNTITSMVDSGNLDNTFSLVKTKIGGDFQGRQLDASVFTDIVPGTHPTTYYTNTRGFDFYSWDSEVWDREVDVENFIGILNEETQGNVNYRVDNETVYGFDAVTFLKSRHGPDRPEELAVVQPLETLVINVHTSNADIETLPGVSTSKSIRYRMFMDLFGKTDFYRQTLTGLTTVSANVNIWENEISVADVSVLPDGNESNKGVIWIGAERIEYTGVDTANNKLLGVVRGTRGTTAQPLIESGAQIFNGEESQNIALQGARDPQIANWLGQDGVSITDTTNSPTTDTIIGFIQNV